MSPPGKHPDSAHFSLARGKHPLSVHMSQPICAAAAGFREPPNKPAWLRETPYTTIPVFPAVTVTVTPQYPARAGIPLCIGDLTHTLQAHISLYINQRSLASKNTSQTKSFHLSPQEPATSPAAVSCNDTRSLGDLDPPTVAHNTRNI